MQKAVSEGFRRQRGEGEHSTLQTFLKFDILHMICLGNLGKINFCLVSSLRVTVGVENQCGTRCLK